MMAEDYINYKLKEIASRLRSYEQKAASASSVDKIIAAHKRDRDATSDQFKLALSDLKYNLKLQRELGDIELELLLLTELMPEAYKDWYYTHTEKRVGVIRRLLANAKKRKEVDHE